MILGYIVPPTNINVDKFWNEKKHICEYSKYDIKEWECANQYTNQFFDEMKIKWSLFNKIKISKDDSDSLLLLLEKINKIKYTRGMEYVHKWIRPYKILLRGLPNKNCTQIKNFCDLYVAICKRGISKSVTLKHTFGSSGCITVTIGETVYYINWRHTYYGIPIRHEEYVFIDGTAFFQDVKDIRYGDDLISFLRAYHHYSVVIPNCVFESHAPKRLEYHLAQGGDFNSWEEIHFPKSQEDLLKQENQVIRQRIYILQVVYLLANVKLYKPWTPDQVEAYCKRY